MKWDDFYRHIAPLSVFDLPMVEQVLSSPRTQATQQIHRWILGGKVLSLRRGIYALSAPYQKRPLSSLLVANEIYRPSYLSGIWALGFFGLIPEKVVLHTSVTTRVTRKFQNGFGEFSYSCVGRDLFRNFSRREIDGFPVWIAEPEKALLDHWYLSPGEWSEARMAEMRFQNFRMIVRARLRQYSEGYPSRVRKAVAVWEAIAKREGGRG